MRGQPPLRRLHPWYACRKTATTGRRRGSTLSPHPRRQRRGRPALARAGRCGAAGGAAAACGPDPFQDEAANGERRESIRLQTASSNNDRIVVPQGETGRIRPRQRRKQQQRRRQPQGQPGRSGGGDGGGRLAAVPLPDGRQLREQQRKHENNTGQSSSSGGGGGGAGGIEHGPADGHGRDSLAGRPGGNGGRGGRGDGQRPRSADEVGDRPGGVGARQRREGGLRNGGSIVQTAVGERKLAPCMT